MAGDLIAAVTAPVGPAEQAHLHPDIHQAAAAGNAADIATDTGTPAPSAQQPAGHVQVTAALENCMCLSQTMSLLVVSVAS